MPEKKQQPRINIGRPSVYPEQLYIVAVAQCAQKITLLGIGQNVPSLRAQRGNLVAFFRE